MKKPLNEPELLVDFTKYIDDTYEQTWEEDKVEGKGELTTQELLAFWLENIANKNAD